MGIRGDPWEVLGVCNRGRCVRVSWGMRPRTSPEAVADRVRLARSLVLWALRVVGLAMLVRGAYLVINRLAFGLSQGDIARGWNAYMGVGEGHMMAAGVASTLIGLTLLLLARPISRLCIPMPDPGCPSCGHTGEVDGQGRCVECGWMLEHPGPRVGRGGRTLERIDDVCDVRHARNVRPGDAASSK